MRRFSIREISGVDFPAVVGAKAAIIKRDASADDTAGKPGFASNNNGARARLRMLVENQRRSRPVLSEAEAVAAGWRALSYADRNALLAEQDTGEDVTFDYANVDVAKLAELALEIRAELIGKAQSQLSRSQAMAAAIDEHPEIFKAARDAKRARLIAGDAEDPATVASRNYAFRLLTAKAGEIRKTNPMSLEAARVEARKLWPDVAARERA